MKSVALAAVVALILVALSRRRDIVGAGRRIIEKHDEPPRPEPPRDQKPR